MDLKTIPLIVKRTRRKKKIGIDYCAPITIVTSLISWPGSLSMPDFRSDYLRGRDGLCGRSANRGKESLLLD